MRQTKIQRPAAPAPPPSRFSWPLLIFLAALALRLLYLWQVREQTWFRQPMLDAEHYDAWARRIAAGDWVGGEVFFMSPGYPYFLAVIYKLFGRSVELVAALQMAMGAFSCVLVYRIARSAFSENEARVAALLCAAYGAAIFNEVMLLKVAGINFLNLLALFLIIEGVARRANGRLWIAGFLIGLSAQFRPTVLLFAPPAAAWVAAAAWIRDRRWDWKPLSSLALGTAAVVLAVALRNYWVAREFVLTTAHGGINFYLGNHPGFDGTYMGLPFARTDPRHEQEDYLREAERRSGRPLNDREASGFWYREAWSHVRSRPAQWAGQVLKKMVVFWNNYEYPINIDYSYFRRQGRTLLSLPLASYGLIAAGALLGLTLFLARPAAGQWFGPAGLLAAYISTYVASGLIFFVVSEYRMPAVPALAAFAGKGFLSLWRSLRCGRRPALAGGLALVAAYGAFTHVRIPGASDCTGQHNLAQNLLQQGNLAEAARELEKAVSGCPEYFDARISLGDAYVRLGRPEPALRQFEAGLRLKPDDPRPHAGLGTLAFRNKRYQEAADRYRMALALRPADESMLSELHTNLGNALARLKRLDEALSHYRQALRFAPGSAVTYNNMAFVYLQLNDPGRAVDSYKKAVELKPDYLSARLKLSKLHMQLGDFAQALAQLQAADRASPGHPQVRAYMELCRRREVPKREGME